MVEKRRSEDAMNPVSRTAHINAGTILTIIIPIIFAMAIGWAKLYSDVEAGKQIYLKRTSVEILSRTIDNKIAASSREINLKMDRNQDALLPKIEKINIEIQKMGIQMARFEEKLNSMGE